MGTCIFLRDFIDGEIADINVRSQLGLEGRPYTTKLVPNDTMEERMSLNLTSTVMCTSFFAQPVVCIAKKTFRC